MTNEEYQSQKLSIIQELARLEKIGWGNEKTDPTIFPYVIVEAINLLMNSKPVENLMDYTQTGKGATELVDDIWSTIACGNGCCFEEPYGFCPEGGCPIHDVKTSDKLYCLNLRTNDIQEI